MQKKPCPLKKKLLKKLTYQATHRGMRELDVVLEEFTHLHLSDLSLSEMGIFKNILEMEDRILFDLLLGDREILQNENHDVLVKLRDHVKERSGGKRLAIF